MRTLTRGVNVNSLSRKQKDQSEFSSLNKYIFLLFMGLILHMSMVTEAAANEPNSNCGCTAPALSPGKLLHCNDIMKDFEKGQERVKVIVNLAEPVETKAKTDWHSKQSLKLLHDKIKAVQTPVLSALSNGEFKLRYRFDNQAGFSGEVTLQGLEKLKNDPRVISVEPVYLLEPHLRQGIPLMHADTYRSSYNGEGVAIAICDTGIDYRHPMLGNGGFPNSKVIGGYDYGDDDADPMPNTWAHGTCCAGIAAGDLGDVGDYIGGVAYNARLYALKITPGSSGSASSDAMVAAWNWCVTHQNDDPTHPILVISTSFGGDRLYGTCDNYYWSMTTAANDAVAAGITILVSSGNDGFCDSIAWPACISSVVSVGAVYDAAFGTYQPCISGSSCATKYSTNQCTGWYAIDATAADMVTSYSNTASFLTVLAPSNQCYTTDIIGSGGYSNGDYYSQFGGTSAACPYTAGAVACLQSAAKTIRGSYLSPSEVRTILTSTGDNITDGKVAITIPRINLEQAINNLGPQPPIAQAGSASAQINTPVTITLVATDDGLPNPPGAMTYIITSSPSNGELSDPGNGIISSVPYSLVSFGNQVVYTPTTGYSGPDSFTFEANDGGVPPDGGGSNPANVSINVIAGLTIFLTEGFESPFVNGAPPGWSKSYKTGAVDWERYNGDYYSSGSHGGTYNALLFVGNYDYPETYLITPAINFPDGTPGATLEFWHKQAFWFPDQDTLMVYYKIGVGGSWTQLASYTTDVPTWTRRTISLPNPGANYYIGFLGNAKYGYGVCIDDVNVTGSIQQLRTLTISSTPGGHTEPNEGDHQYNNGTVVDINAVPDAGYHFVNWTGTGITAGKVANPNAASTTITMDGDYTVDANFASIDAPVLNAEPNITPGLCNMISWNAVSGANEYYAECSSDPCFLVVDYNSGWITRTFYQFCGLTSCQEYWYRVKSGLSAWSQTSQAEFQNDTLMDTTPTSSGDVILDTVGTDVVGNTNYSFDTDIDGYFNGFLVTTGTTLTQIEIYLGISTSRSIEFVVYEGGPLFTDSYNRIHSSTLADSGTGTKFYSSGPISVPLEAGRHYMIGAVWNGSVTIYYDETRSSPAFADHTGWGYYLGFPSPDILSDFADDAYTFYYRYTTAKASSQGSVVSTPINLPAGGNWDVVDFNTTTPVDTELTVDILPAAGLIPIIGYEDVSVGFDLSGISEPTIRLRANLSTSDSNSTPALHDWSVTYTDPAGAESVWSNIESSIQVIPGDFELDCDVDWDDLAVLVDQWLQPPGIPSADIAPLPQGDGTVNFLDFAEFAMHWLEGI